MESIMSWVISALSGHVSREMIVFIISMVPILELRGGLLAASVLNINITRALWICNYRKYYSGSVHPAADHTDL